MHTYIHACLGALRLQGMEGLVAEVSRSHGDVALELEGRKQREAALQRELARHRAALGEAANRIRRVLAAGLGAACLLRGHAMTRAGGAAGSVFTWGAAGEAIPGELDAGLRPATGASVCVC